MGLTESQLTYVKCLSKSAEYCRKAGNIWNACHLLKCWADFEGIPLPVIDCYPNHVQVILPSMENYLNSWYFDAKLKLSASTKANINELSRSRGNRLALMPKPSGEEDEEQ